MVQLQILSKILKSKDMSFIINKDITSEQMIGYEDEFNFILNHYKKYGNVPDVETFIDKFEDFQLVEVFETENYLYDTLQEEYLYSKLVPIVQKTAELLKTDSIKAYEYIQKEMSVTAPVSGECGVDIIKHARDRYEEYKAKQNKEIMWAYPTGFKELDDKINGLSKGEEFMVIVARTNQGKSWILARILTHNWKIGVNVGYISPEMSASQVGYRFDTLNEHFSNSDLYRGNEVDSYEDYINFLTNSKNGFIVATPMDFNNKITVTKLKNFVIKNNIEILGIDGISYLTDERYSRGDNRTTSLTNISEDLMALSCELKIPVIVVVQAKRGSHDNESQLPDVEDIRDSDGISYNASKILSMRQKNDNLILQIRKNRTGPVNVRLGYSWNIDKGLFEYNPEAGEYNETTEEVTPYQRHKQNSNENTNSENKQPLRRTTATPF